MADILYKATLLPYRYWVNGDHHRTTISLKFRSCIIPARDDIYPDNSEDMRL